LRHDRKLAQQPAYYSSWAVERAPLDFGVGSALGGYCRGLGGVRGCGETVPETSNARELRVRGLKGDLAG
jgi:hypothetical protein